MSLGKVVTEGVQIAYIKELERMRVTSRAQAQ